MSHVPEELVRHLLEVLGGALDVGEGVLDFYVDLRHAFHVSGVLLFDFPYCGLEGCSCSTTVTASTAVC